MAVRRRRPATRTTARIGTRTSAPTPASTAPAAAPAPAPAPNPALPQTGSSSNLPTVQPFLSPEQQQVNIENQTQYEEALHAIDDQLAKMGIDKTYQQTQIEKGRVKNDSAANDSAAARGIFSSSIRAGDLADIDASAALRDHYLTDQFKLATTQGEERKLRLTSARNAFLETERLQAVVNAQAQTPQTPDEGTQQIIAAALAAQGQPQPLTAEQKAEWEWNWNHMGPQPHHGRRR